MHVHFVAIAGTGMGSLAGLLKQKGWEVTGSDVGVYPPMSTALENWGIPVALEFSAANVLDRRPDLVVIGNAVRPDNPEARAALDEGLNVSSFPDALFDHAIRGKHSVVVTGTHGKTTTTSMIATLLHAAGRDPAMLVGGIATNFDSSFRDGAGPEFIVEGDEYDTVFFDKTPKFLHYHPDTLVITSIEFDHADIYRDLDHIQQQFHRLVSEMPEEGRIIAASGSRAVDEVVAGAPCAVDRYAVTEMADYTATELGVDADGTRFEIQARDEAPVLARLSMVGPHNMANALAAVAVAHRRGVPLEEAAAGLDGYRGVKRRQELRGEVGGVRVIDDFAHHPTAVRETLAALAHRYEGQRLVAIFEPRSNTSRRALFQEQYAKAFRGAGHVVIAEVSDAPIYSATGEVTEFLSAQQLAADLSEQGISAVACADADAIVEHLRGELVKGDVVVTLSNGGFDGIWDKLLDALRERA